MSEGISSIDEAASALHEAAAAPEPAQAPEPVQPVETSVAPPVTPEGQSAAEGTTEQDSFTKTDLNSLLEGVTDPAARDRIEAAYRGFQGDYTRKTQDLAERAKAYEGIDPDRARASLQFVEALENDPSFAVQVHQELTNALVANGYTPGEAAAAASTALGEESLGGGFDDEGQVSALAKELNGLKEWVSQQEQQKVESNLAAQIQRQEMAIRQADPSITDPEMDRIYELAFAHGGDLSKAHQAYSNWKNDTIASYLNSKTEIPAASPPVTTHSELPQSAPTDMREATRLAREYLERELAG